jgi:hypothetical protein
MFTSANGLDFDVGASTASPKFIDSSHFLPLPDARCL